MSKYRINVRFNLDKPMEAKATAVQASCIKQNTVQPLFRDCTVSYIKLRYPPVSKAIDLFFCRFTIYVLEKTKKE